MDEPPPPVIKTAPLVLDKVLECIEVKGGARGLPHTIDLIEADDGGYLRLSGTLLQMPNVGSAFAIGRRYEVLVRLLP